MDCEPLEVASPFGRMESVDMVCSVAPGAAGVELDGMAVISRPVLVAMLGSLP